MKAAGIWVFVYLLVLEEVEPWIGQLDLKIEEVFGLIESFDLLKYKWSL
jgi:hypothetical protein